MTTRTNLAHLPAWPRLLTRGQAAAYCQLHPDKFESACPVKPIRLHDSASQQSRRWDRHAIDAWLDRLGGGRDAAGDRQHWIAQIDADDDEVEARPAH